MKINGRLINNGYYNRVGRLSPLLSNPRQRAAFFSEKMDPLYTFCSAATPRDTDKVSNSLVNTVADKQLNAWKKIILLEEVG